MQLVVRLICSAVREFISHQLTGCAKFHALLLYEVLRYNQQHGAWIRVSYFHDHILIGSTIIQWRSCVLLMSLCFAMIIFL